MTPEAFLIRLDELIHARDHQGIIDWYEAEYPLVRPLLSAEEQASIEEGVMKTTYGIVERRQHRLQAEEAAERDLAPAA
jgi:hypothetical protein